MNNERRKAIKSLYGEIEITKGSSHNDSTLEQLAENIGIAIRTFNERKQEIKSSLEELRDAEEEYIDNMPENMQSGEKYDAAKQAVSDLDEAIDMLDDTDDFEGFDKDDLIGKLDEVAGG